jgi:hypothetical protein
MFLWSSHTFWRGGWWRFWRVTTLVTAAAALVVLGLEWGSVSLLVPFDSLLFINIVANVFLFRRTGWLRERTDDTSP